MKAIVLNRKFYIRPDNGDPNRIFVWKNNGMDAHDQLVAGPFTSKTAALEIVKELEAKARNAVPNNQGMNNATDILLGYLAENPEITKGLLDKAIKHAAAKKRAIEAARRAEELAAALTSTDRQIAAAQAEINKLRGLVLSLQKKRKRIADEVIALSKEFGV